jgi:hypothetical protein
MDEPSVEFNDGGCDADWWNIPTVAVLERSAAMNAGWPEDAFHPMEGEMP